MHPYQCAFVCLCIVFVCLQFALLYQWREVETFNAIEILSRTLSIQVNGLHSVRCQGDFFNISKYCYHIAENESNWKDAKRHCEDMGGHLIQIEDYLEQSIVSELISTRGFLVPSFIGLLKDNRSGAWIWVDDVATANYTNWAGLHPLNGFCAAVVDAGDWVSVNCSNKLSYICEVDISPLQPVSSPDEIYQEGYYRGVILLSALCGVFLAVFLYLDNADVMTGHHLRYKKSKEKRFQNKVKSSTTIIDVDPIFPSLLHSQPLVKVFLYEMNQSHRWVSLFTNFNPEFPRSLRLLSLGTSVFTALFFISLVYSYISCTDTYCGTYNTQLQCIAAEDTFFLGDAKCQWDEIKSACYSDIETYPVRFIFLAVFISALLSVPVCVVVDCLIMEVLIKPVEDDVDCDDFEVDDCDREWKPKRPSFFQDIYQKALTSHKVGAEEDPEAEKALHDMLVGLLEYRSSLSPLQKAELDAAWNLDFNHVQEYVSHVYTPSNDLTPAVMDAITPGGVKALRESIRATRTSAARVISMMTQLDQSSQRRRLLLLLQRDLLLASSGIAAVKVSDLDRILTHTLSVPQSCKFLTLSFIAAIDISFLLYSYSFTLHHPADVQNSWICSILVWFCIEIVLISTLAMFCRCIFVSSLMFKTWRNVKHQLAIEINKYNSLIQNNMDVYRERGERERSSAAFDVCKYLFVSRLVAEAFPAFPESIVVKSFVFDDPVGSNLRSITHSTRWDHALVKICYWISNSPAYISENFIRLLYVCIFGYIVVLFTSTPLVNFQISVGGVLLCATLISPCAYVWLKRKGDLENSITTTETRVRQNSYDADSNVVIVVQSNTPSKGREITVDVMRRHSTDVEDEDVILTARNVEATFFEDSNHACDHEELRSPHRCATEMTIRNFSSVMESESSASGFGEDDEEIQRMIALLAERDDSDSVSRDIDSIDASINRESDTSESGSDCFDYGNQNCTRLSDRMLKLTVETMLTRDLSMDSADDARFQSPTSTRGACMKLSSESWSEENQAVVRSHAFLNSKLLGVGSDSFVSVDDPVIRTPRASQNDMIPIPSEQYRM